MTIWSKFFKGRLRAGFDSIVVRKGQSRIPARAVLRSFFPTVTCAFFLSVLLSFVSVNEATAKMYKYVDSNGASVVVDDIKKVPAEYRDQVKEAKLAPVVTEATPQQGTSTEAVPVVTVEEEVAAINAIKEKQRLEGRIEQAPVPQKSGRIGRFKARVGRIYNTPGVSFLIISAALVVGFFFLITGGMMLGDRFGQKKLGSLIALAITAGVLLYVFSAYSEKMSANFRMALNLIDTVKASSTKVSKESERALKESEVGYSSDQRHDPLNVTSPQPPAPSAESAQGN